MLKKTENKEKLIDRLKRYKEEAKIVIAVLRKLPEMMETQSSLVRDMHGGFENINWIISDIKITSRCIADKVGVKKVK